MIKLAEYDQLENVLASLIKIAQDINDHYAPKSEIIRILNIKISAKLFHILQKHLCHDEKLAESYYSTMIRGLCDKVYIYASIHHLLFLYI